MGRVKVSLTIVAIIISTIIFLLSWGLFGSGIGAILFPDAAKSLVEPANNAIASWNSFAIENGINVVVTAPITLEDPVPISPTDDGSSLSTEDAGASGDVVTVG